jgi:hypothetical protein
MSTSELALVADALIGRHGRLDGAMLVRIEEDSFGVRPIDCHPAEALARLRVPSSWVGLGVLCGAWAAPLDGVGRPSRHPKAERIVLAVLLGRDGSVVSRMRWPDGRVAREAPAVGEVLQAMRRALGQVPPAPTANLA